jgi:hypothetical protein
MPKRKGDSKKGITVWENCHKEGRKWEKSEEKLWEGRDNTYLRNGRRRRSRRSRRIRRYAHFL